MRLGSKLSTGAAKNLARLVVGAPRDRQTSAREISAHREMFMIVCSKGLIGGVVIACSAIASGSTEANAVQLEYRFDGVIRASMLIRNFSRSTSSEFSSLIGTSFTVTATVDETPIVATGGSCSNLTTSCYAGEAHVLMSGVDIVSGHSSVNDGIMMVFDNVGGGEDDLSVVAAVRFSTTT